MRKTAKEPEMQPEYDFAGGVRGKFAKRYAQGTNVVVLEPDVARAFPNSTVVNESLQGGAQSGSIAKALKRHPGRKA